MRLISVLKNRIEYLDDIRPKSEEIENEITFLKEEIVKVIDESLQVDRVISTCKKAILSYFKYDRYCILDTNEMVSLYNDCNFENKKLLIYLLNEYKDIIFSEKEIVTLEDIDFSIFYLEWFCD